jgi:hypothetical protein
MQCSAVQSPPFSSALAHIGVWILDFVFCILDTFFLYSMQRLAKWGVHVMQFDVYNEVWDGDRDLGERDKFSSLRQNSSYILTM